MATVSAIPLVGFMKAPRPSWTLGIPGVPPLRIQTIIVSPNDQLEIVCDWDTSGKDTPTFPGLGTSNEMCLLGIYAAEVK